MHFSYLKDAPNLFSMIDACKKLVQNFKQANLQYLLTKTLKQENETRWSSLYQCINSVFKMYDEVVAILTPCNRVYFIYLVILIV